MKLYCEVVVGEVLPALRALITNELIQKYSLTQKEIADKLGLTQPAISQYKKFLRGEGVKDLQKNKKIMSIIKDFAQEISNDKISVDETFEKILKISHIIVDKKIVYNSEIIQEKAPCKICFS